MRFALFLVLLPALAFAESPKLDTVVSMRIDDDNKAVFTAFDEALRTPTGTRVDACWHKAGHLRATLGFDDGKVTSVEIVRLDDSGAKDCITKALHAVVLGGATGHAVAEIDLEASAHPDKVALLDSKNRKVLDTIIDKNLSTNLSKFSGIKGDVGTGTGTGVAQDFTGSKVTAGPMDTPPSDGELSPDEINRVIRARAGVFRACYQKEVSQDPKLAGKVVMRFTIKADGVTTKVSVASSTLKSPAVESCLIKQIEHLKFPAKSVAHVDYPFVFSPG